MNVNWPCRKCFSFHDIKKSGPGCEILCPQRAQRVSQCCHKPRTQKKHWCVFICECDRVCPAAVWLHLVTRFCVTLLIRLLATDCPHRQSWFVCARTHTHFLTQGVPRRQDRKHPGCRGNLGSTTGQACRASPPATTSPGVCCDVVAFPPKSLPVIFFLSCLFSSSLSLFVSLTV